VDTLDKMRYCFRRYFLETFADVVSSLAFLPLTIFFLLEACLFAWFDRRSVFGVVEIIAVAY
jgi:hypothetical protein